MGSNVKELLTAKQVGSKLGLRPETIRTMARRRQLPSVKLSRGIVRFDWGAVVETLRKHERSAAAV
jgi:hypothetical protein